MDAGRRAALVRLATPAAFLLAATIAVLLIRAGLSGGHPSLTSAPVTEVSPSPVTSPQTTSEPAPPKPTKKRYYDLRAGDTLAGVARRYKTTVDRLLELNPGVRPTSLRIGHKIRVE